MTEERGAGGGDPDADSAPVPDVADPGAGDPGPDQEAGGGADDTDTATGDGRVGSRDGGVTTRLIRRCLTAALILVGVAVLCLLPVTLRGWDAPSAVFALLSLVAIVGGVIMSRRWALWRSVALAPLPLSLGFPATAGDPRALSPRPTGWPIKRRFGALVLPLRADAGVTPGDGALIVHARADAAAPRAGDRLRVVPIARRGGPVALATDPRAAVHVLLVRDRDDTVFVATTRVTDTW